ncbi:hypothetical protein [Peribacillus butanolivorans]|uniref:hypothetical protein n=1 Tax=Peribacillus butanolivorans TaxID=421767 RepID=UPI0036530EAB
MLVGVVQAVSVIMNREASTGKAVSLTPESGKKELTLSFSLIPDTRGDTALE